MINQILIDLGIGLVTYVVHHFIVKRKVKKAISLGYAKGFLEGKLEGSQKVELAFNEVRLSDFAFHLKNELNLDYCLLIASKGDCIGIGRTDMTEDQVCNTLARSCAAMLK